LTKYILYFALRAPAASKNDPVIFFEPARVTHPIEQPII